MDLESRCAAESHGLMRTKYPINATIKNRGWPASIPGNGCVLVIQCKCAQCHCVEGLLCNESYLIFPGFPLGLSWFTQWGEVLCPLSLELCQAGMMAISAFLPGGWGRCAQGRVKPIKEPFHFSYPRSCTLMHYWSVFLHLHENIPEAAWWRGPVLFTRGTSLRF